MNTNGIRQRDQFHPWQPLAFFTNAADRMLKAYTAQWARLMSTNQCGATARCLDNPNFVATFNVTAPFGVTNIPVWVSNRFVYTPAVQRVLQLAANIYDATTRFLLPVRFPPASSRDQRTATHNVFITGYTNVSYCHRTPTIRSLRSPLTP